MKDKFCAFERRTKMLFYITQVKFATRLELAEEFNVSLATINRDILILSSIAPIYTKQGNGGGISYYRNSEVIRTILRIQKKIFCMK